MVEFDGKIYELKYNMKTLEKIEQATGKGIMNLIAESNGMLALAHLKIMFALALFNEDGNRIGQLQGLDIAEKLMINEGYAKLNELVVVTIDKDCPFLFQVD